MTTRTLHLEVPATADLREDLAVDLTFDDVGEGRPVLLLHGGAGPASMASLAALSTQDSPARVVTPTHPGFDGTPRPPALGTVAALAAVYAELLEALDLSGVTLVGNSIGGWVAAEMAADDQRAGAGAPRVGSVVLVDAVGLEVPGHPVTDVNELSGPELMALSFYDPAPYAVDPASVAPAQRAAMAANFATRDAYGNQPGQPVMTDPTLGSRLSAITAPTLVVWGAADGVVTPDYGRAFAAAVPGARFEVIEHAGHMPQVEAPEELRGLVMPALAQAVADRHRPGPRVGADDGPLTVAVL